MIKMVCMFFYSLYRVFVYLVFLTGVLLAFPASLILSLWGGKRAANKYPQYLSKLLCCIIPAKIEVVGKENINPQKSYVVVLNHRSTIDIIAVYASLNMDIRWIMKKELTKVPVFGQTSLLLGNIPIDRRNTRKAVESIDQAKKTLVSGTSVAFFPEGTRVTDADLGSFKKGAFHFALDVGIPVLPVALVGTEFVMPKKSYNFRPGKIKMIIHPPVDSTTYSKKSVNAFSNEVHSILSRTLEKEMPAEDPANGEPRS